MKCFASNLIPIWSQSHELLLAAIQHNDTRKRCSTEGLSDNIDKLEKVNIHWDEPCVLMKKAGLQSKKYVFKEVPFKRVAG